MPVGRFMYPPRSRSSRKCDAVDRCRCYSFREHFCLRQKTILQLNELSKLFGMESHSKVFIVRLYFKIV